MSLSQPSWDGHERRRLPDAQRVITLDGDHYDRSMGLLLDAIERLTGAVHELRDAQATSVATGLAATLTDKELVGRTMTVVGEITAERTQRAAGRSVLGAIKSLFRHWLLIAVVVAVVASMYGWGPAKEVGRVIFNLESKP